MKLFNRIARVVGGAGLIAVTGVAYWKMGWQGAAIAVAAGVCAMWSACPPEEHRGGKAALQVTIEDEEHCHTHFNGCIFDIELYAPAAIASICVGAEHASDGILTRGKIMNMAELIMNDKSEAVKIVDTKKI